MLEEDDNDSFSSPTTRYSGPGTSVGVNGQADGTWYYRVMAEGSVFDSLWSNTESVEVNLTSYSYVHLPLILRSP